MRVQDGRLDRILGIRAVSVVSTAVLRTSWCPVSMDSLDGIALPFARASHGAECCFFLPAVSPTNAHCNRRADSALGSADVLDGGMAQPVTPEVEKRSFSHCLSLRYRLLKHHFTCLCLRHGLLPHHLTAFPCGTAF